jgi:hypothetical protein
MTIARELCVCRALHRIAAFTVSYLAGAWRRPQTAGLLAAATTANNSWRTTSTSGGSSFTRSYAWRQPRSVPQARPTDIVGLGDRHR